MWLNGKIKFEVARMPKSPLGTVFRWQNGKRVEAAAELKQSVKQEECE